MAQRPHTPENSAQILPYDQHESGKHYTTPQTSRMIGGIELANHLGVKGKKEEIFKYYGFSHTAGYRALAGREAHSERRLHNAPDAGPDPRGRKSKLTREDLRKMEEWIEQQDAQGRSATWKNLAKEAGVEQWESISQRTIHRAMEDLDYHKCIACDKAFISQHYRTERKTYSRNSLAERPQPEDWHPVRFSDEVHFGLGPQKKLRIIRRPGERYCWNCIQERKEQRLEDVKKVHAWGDVGWDYKIDKLIIYNVPTNNNGKMTGLVYTKEILEPYVLPCAEQAGKETYVLLEDNDSGHGTSKGARVTGPRKWKRDNGVRCIFNAPKSPDLNIVENCWQPLKEYVTRADHFDEDEVINTVHEGWDRAVKQSFINRLVDSMPDRLHQVLDRDGRISSY